MSFCYAKNDRLSHRHVRDPGVRLAITRFRDRLVARSSLAKPAKIKAALQNAQHSLLILLHAHLCFYWNCMLIYASISLTIVACTKPVLDFSHKVLCTCAADVCE